MPITDRITITNKYVNINNPIKNILIFFYVCINFQSIKLIYKS